MGVSPIVRLRVRARRIVRNEHVTLGVLAFVVGAAAAYGALLFRLAVGFIQEGAFGFSFDRLMPTTDRLLWWHVLLVPTLGGLVVGLILHRFHNGGRAHSIAQVIEASALRGGRISARDGAVSTVVHAVSLGVGGAAGREGPIVHLGATIGAWISARLRLPRGHVRTLLACGAAAGIGSLFNAPVAGAVFAIEVIVGNLSLRAAAPIFVAAVTGTAIGRYYFGDEPSFKVPPHELISLWEFPAFLLLGVVCAVVAIAFMRSIFLVDGLVARSRIPVWLRPMLGGLVIGLIGLEVPEVLGVGYLPTDAALHGEFVLTTLVVLLVAKIAAVAVTLGSGFGGGVFSPALFLGAMVGGAYGIVAGDVFPELFSGVPAYALIGTGALAGAVMGAPLSTIFIIFELTGSSEMTVAVMIATAVASVLTTQFFGRSFFHVQLSRRGVEVSGGHDQAVLQGLTVGRIMRRNVPTLLANAPIETVHGKLHETVEGEAYVVDDGGVLLGLVTYADVNTTLLEHYDDEDRPSTAGEIAQDVTEVLLPGQPIEEAQRAIERSGHAALPVVATLEGMQLRGVVTALDIARAHNDALLNARAEEHR